MDMSGVRGGGASSSGGGDSAVAIAQSLASGDEVRRLRAALEQSTASKRSSEEFLRDARESWLR